ncbi:MAG TPA: hypothetical protein VGS41_13775, partial [Chthonomonadales bacterium]|nr:hypothetical protein [Chthonomonadales bacterium]
MSLELKRRNDAPEKERGGDQTKTIIGWQGIRCALPADWSVSGFSMDRHNGYLRVDSPGTGTQSVQIRWQQIEKQRKAGTTPFQLLAQWTGILARKPAATAMAKPDLKANIERMFKESAKQARKNRSAFETTIKPERIEGDSSERTAINFSWSGSGKGQGKIWHCSACNRVVVAQVVGMAKDAIGVTASQLLATLQDHSTDGYDLWALYGLRFEAPSDFVLYEQKLLSGYLRLAFRRAGERIVLDRWGLANVALKRFSLREWFEQHSLVSTRNLTVDETATHWGHSVLRLRGDLPFGKRLTGLRDSALSPRSAPAKYDGHVWRC